MSETISKLHEMGIEVIDENGNFKTLLDILNEILSKYNGINKKRVI